MKRALILPLTDEELLELQRIILDEDRENALRFLKKHFADKEKGTLEEAGHCNPRSDLPGRSYVPDEFKR